MGSTFFFLFLPLFFGLGAKLNVRVQLLKDFSRQIDDVNMISHIVSHVHPWRKFTLPFFFLGGIFFPLCFKEGKKGLYGDLVKIYGFHSKMTRGL